MPPPGNPIQHERHFKLLLSRVLDHRASASPFTLILDDLNQPAQPLVAELIRRALSRNLNVVELAFERARPRHTAVQFIPGWSPQAGGEKQLLAALDQKMNGHKESVIIIDSLHELLVERRVDMNTLFNLIAVKHNSVLIGVYHTDLNYSSSQSSTNAYAPDPLTLLKFTATTILTCRSFSQVLAAKRAKERSVAEPSYGMLQETEGVVQALSANTPAGLVLDAEFRRRSGRPEFETFFLRSSTAADYAPAPPGKHVGALKAEFVILLDQHPAYAQRLDTNGGDATDEMLSTFNLELTARQKEAREGVVLPYFDAQKEGGGEGGRILYDMGEEDDFDEEEDEI